MTTDIARGNGRLVVAKGSDQVEIVSALPASNRPFALPHRVFELLFPRLQPVSVGSLA
jgi:hypothetical protein